MAVAGSASHYSSGMAELLLFHHAQGLTRGVRDFAETLRSAGHVVHTPDLYEGRVFGTLMEGLAYAEEIGFETIEERGAAAAADLPAEIVYAGFSLGVMPAQALAASRPGAKGALLFHATVPVESWPSGVPMQIHTMADDELGDLDIAEEVVETVPEAELFRYPGDGHIFADSTLPDYDEAATNLLVERVLAFLAKVG